ncbi:hypothetical protein D3C80_1654170 [compost metagenome]
MSVRATHAYIGITQAITGIGIDQYRRGLIQQVDNITAIIAFGNILAGEGSGGKWRFGTGPQGNYLYRSQLPVTGSVLLCLYSGSAGQACNKD